MDNKLINNLCTKAIPQYVNSHQDFNQMYMNTQVPIDFYSHPSNIYATDSFSFYCQFLADKRSIMSRSAQYQQQQQRHLPVNKKHHSNRQLNRRSTDPDNCQKACPGCDRYWKFCKCSNIKERPDPKPYCKFVPPRLLKAKKLTA